MTHRPITLPRPPHGLPVATGLSALLLATAALAWSGSASAQSHGMLHAGSHGPRIGLTVSAPLIQVGGRHRGGGYRHGGGHWRGHGHGHGHGWAGLALGLGIGALILARPWEPVVVEQRPAYVYTEPPQTPPAPVPPVSAATDLGQVYSTRPAEPVIYPARGQSPAQAEADRIECNRWATTQPSAMADASIFHRATLACLEGRGYSVR